MGDLTPKSGEINLLPDNQSVKIGYVPQFRNIDDEYPLSIEEFVALNLTKRHTPWLSKAERDRVNAVIERTKLTTIAERPLGKASGGEKQRAYLAQALLQDPNLLILDESTASLDVDRKYELLDVVNQLNLSVLFITHDLPLVRHYADHFLLLQHGKYSVGTIDELPQIDGEAGVEHV